MENKKGQLFIRRPWQLWLLLSLLCVACGRAPEKSGQEPGKLQAVFEEVLAVATEQPDRAIQMADSLKREEVLPVYQTDLLRARIYAQSLESRRLDSAIIICERLMKQPEAETNNNQRYNLLDLLIRACRDAQDDEQMLHWTTEMIELCHLQGEETEALRNEAELGVVLTKLGRADEGEARIDSVINRLSGKRKFNEMDALIIAHKRKVNVLEKAERYSDIPPVAQSIVDILTDFEQHPDEFHDGSYREVTEPFRPEYIDFYRSQAYGYMAYAYAETGDKAASRRFLALYEEGGLAKTFEGRKQMAPTWCLLGEYDKMEEVYTPLEAALRAQGDTASVEYATILRNRAIAAEARGRKDEALHLYKEYEDLNNTINEQLLKGNAHLYAARFHAQEQQNEIERQKVNRRKAVTASIIISIIALLVLFFAIFASIAWRKTKQHNRALARQISEAVESREKNRELQQAPAMDPSTLSNEQLFLYLKDLIARDELFLKKDFGRQTLIERTGLPKERIGAAFAQGGGDRITTFIRELRLDYAVHLMNGQPQLGVEQISRSSGFLSADTFTRSFRSKFGMTPTAYKQNKGNSTA